MDGAAAVGKVNLRVQPPAMLPLSLAASSRTYSDQVPFGSSPLKADNVVPYGPPGAGLGKVSPVTKSVGLYVPATMAELSGSLDAAASSNVSVTLLMPA